MPTWHTPPWKMVMSPWPVPKAIGPPLSFPQSLSAPHGRQCQVSSENDYDLTVGVTIVLWAIPQHGLTRWGRRELHQSHSTIYIYLCTHTWCALVHDIVCFETRSAEQRRSRHLILTIKANIWCEVVECWYIFQHVMLTWDADMTFNMHLHWGLVPQEDSSIIHYDIEEKPWSFKSSQSISFFLKWCL